MKVTVKSFKEACENCKSHDEIIADKAQQPIVDNGNKIEFQDGELWVKDSFANDYHKVVNRGVVSARANECAKKSSKKVTESKCTNDPKYDELWSKYVPSSGKADTVLGEILRAAGRIWYRWYNDGDKFYEGYGAETAGSSALYLLRDQPVGSLTNLVAHAEDMDYDTFVNQLDDAIYDLIHNESKVQELSSQSNSYDSTMDHRDEAEGMWGDDPEDEEEWY